MDDSGVIRTLFLTVVAEVISFGVAIPIVPLLFTEPSFTHYLVPEAWGVNAGFILLGLAIGLYPLGQFLSTPILGELSDIYGRKKMIQASVIGTVVATVLFGLGIMAGSLAVVMLSRFFNGLTGGLISISQATVADVTDENSRSSQFGLIGAAFGIGFILGPFLGGVLSSDLLPFFSITLPFWFSAIVSFLSLVYLSFKLRETSPMEQKKVNWKKPFTQIRKGLRLPDLKPLFGANFFYFSGFAFFTTFIPVYLVKNFGLNQLQTGLFFLYAGILVVLGQGVLVRYIFERFEEARVMPLVLFLTGFFIFLQPVPSSLAVFLAVVAAFSFNNALTQVSLNTLVSINSSKEDQGLALGTNQSLRALGNAIPSMISGFTAAILTPSAPLFIAGIIIMSTAVVYSAVTGRFRNLHKKIDFYGRQRRGT